MPVSSYTNPVSFSCNVHVLVPQDPSTENRVIVVDPGYCGREVLDAVRAGGGLGAILLTHGHWDHIGCTEALLAEWPGAPVYVHERDAGFLTDPRLNGSAAMGRVPITIGACATTLVQGGLEVAGSQLEVLHTPGHTAGSCVFRFPAENLLFTGDTIMEGGVGRTDLPTGSRSQLVSSLRKLFDAGLDARTTCLVGHGRTMTWEALLKSARLIQ